jgi:hypothetical protein
MNFAKRAITSYLFIALAIPVFFLKQHLRAQVLP